MKKDRTSLFGLLLIGSVWGFLGLACLLKPADEFSMSERRKLAQLPRLQAEAVLSGSFMKEFESYTLDQFPFRDRFRTIKAASEFYLLGKSDNNEIYLADGYAAKLEYPLNQSSLDQAIMKLQSLYETYVDGKADRVYLSVIPDKGYFLAEKSGHPAMDYASLFIQMEQAFSDAEVIDLASHLRLENYYKTDTHWKQETLTDLAKQIAEQLQIRVSGDYETIVTEQPFYGVYYGQAALPIGSDTICYLTNEALEACTAYHVENGKTLGLYDLEKLDSKDAYEVYLSGASAIVTIENPNADTERELVVFRDSFASSLIPLLAEGYAKITLVDTRYVAPELLGKFVEFSGADVWFLYSTTVLNNSSVLK